VTRKKIEIKIERTKQILIFELLWFAKPAQILTDCGQLNFTRSKAAMLDDRMQATSRAHARLNSTAGRISLGMFAAEEPAVSAR
jgi:hypothetical protein